MKRKFFKAIAGVALCVTLGLMPTKTSQAEPMCYGYWSTLCPATWGVCCYVSSSQTCWVWVHCPNQ
jgi:hypothetical protein